MNGLKHKKNFFLATIINFSYIKCIINFLDANIYSIDRCFCETKRGMKSIYDYNHHWTRPKVLLENIVFSSNI